MDFSWLVAFLLAALILVLGALAVALVLVLREEAGRRRGT
jgi:hypothetical protein